MAKVSVIVPIYNVEQYVERCAQSLFEQTLDDIEYIFVDDCSPDNSMRVLEETIKKYPLRKQQVKQCRMPFNSGLAAVRRKGYELATGDYVIACDSDDYVDKRMYESLYKYAIDNDADMVHCDISVINGKQETIKTLTISGDTTSEAIRKGLINGTISNSLCNKLVKRSIITDHAIHYAEAAMDEDNTVAVQFAYYSNKIGYLHEPFYKAYLNTDSISRVEGVEQTLKRFEGAYKNSKIIVDFLLSKGYDKESLAVINAKLRPKLALVPSLQSPSVRKKWKEIYPEVDGQILKSKDVPTKVKIKCVLIRMGLFPIAKKIIRKG